MGLPKQRAYMNVDGVQVCVHTDADLLDALAEAVNVAAGQIVVGSAAKKFGIVDLAGDATMAADGTLTITANAITTPEITDLAVTTAKLADLGVTTAKIADLGVTTAKIADLNVTNAQVADATLVTGKLVADTIALTVDIPILVTGAAVTVAADAIATPTWTHTTVKVDTATIKHLKSAKLILDYVWAATADGTIQLYDSTGLAVRAETTAKVGAEASEWEEVAATGLVAGNTMAVRANVTVAGLAGETTSLFRAILRLTLGVS